jgi:hypothetical protein
MTARRLTAVIVCAAIMTAASIRLSGQNRGAGPAPATARSSAPIDLTGYWVPVVSEDWRFRMVTPRKGDYQSVPMTPEARKMADAWDPAADAAAGNQCRAYGAAAFMRVPGRLRISWQDDATLRVEMDAGTQTRLFHFSPVAAPAADATWQGQSVAAWERPAAPRGGGPPPTGGSLRVVTSRLRGGYLRRNGVPYSENAIVTEYLDIGTVPPVGEVLLVTAVVEDPRFLQQPFIVSSHFKKEPDGSRWDPTPCSSTW